MPVLWQASQRPMYVRTVWVDGFRHAIFTNDDPYLLKLQTKRRRPHSSASCVPKPKANSRLSYRSDLDNCMRSFNLVVTNSRGRIEKTDCEIEKLDLSELKQESTHLEIKGNVPEVNESVEIDMRNLRVNKTARSEKENTELSDRVLQWLDLAGKVDMLAPDNAERMNQPRHSWPELQRRNVNLTKSKTVVDIRKTQSPKCSDNTKAQQNTCIDRHEFYSSPTIENYARQSRNAKITTRCEINPLNKKTKDIKTNIMEARQKVVNERNAVEKQYAELISKKLIPDVGTNAKKQVHIFMPEMPKKTASNNTSRTESLLSHNSIKSLKQ